MEKSQRLPSLECLYQFYQEGGVNLHRLLNGEGEKYLLPQVKSGKKRKTRRFSGRSLAQLAAGFLMEISLPAGE